MPELQGHKRKGTPRPAGSEKASSKASTSSSCSPASANENAGRDTHERHHTHRRLWDRSRRRIENRKRESMGCIDFCKCRAGVETRRGTLQAERQQPTRKNCL